MKKALSILLVCGLLCLCACGKTPPKEDTPQDSITGNYKAAVAAIDSGDYRTAYDLLKGQEDEQSKALLKHFVFVPTAITSNIKGEDYDFHFSTELTYDAKGNVLKHVRTDKGDVTETVYTYADERLIKEVATSDDFTRTQEYAYDAAGRLIRHHRTDRHGSRSNEITYTYVYDDKGNLTEEKRISVYGDSGGEGITTTYQYDADGKEVYKKIDLGYDYLISEYPTEFYWEYREDGTLYKYTERDGNADRVTEYDEKGREWRLWFYPTDPLDNKPYIFYEYTYDNADRVVKKTYAEGADYYTYDEKGNLIEESNGTDRTVYTYNEDGNCLSETRYNLGGKITWQKAYTYDAGGNVLSDTITYGDGQTEATVNTYDADGNRLTQVYDGYSSETGSDITITESVAWTVFYYPDGVPEAVEEELYSLTIPPNAA